MVDVYLIGITYRVESYDIALRIADAMKSDTHKIGQNDDGTFWIVYLSYMPVQKGQLAWNPEK